MLAILHLGLDVIFFDADLVFFRDPTRQILYEASGRDFMFSTEHTTQSLSPSLIYAKSASILAVKTLIYYAVWLFSNPWASDFHGWGRDAGQRGGGPLWRLQLYGLAVQKNTATRRRSAFCTPTRPLEKQASEG